MMEAIVATAITVIAVVGLAHTFGLGRGFIDRFGVARAALTTAQARLEILSVLPAGSDSLRRAASNPLSAPFYFRGRQAGTESWWSVPYDDPATAAVNDLRMEIVVVRWGQGADRDSLRLSRLFPY